MKLYIITMGPNPDRVFFFLQEKPEDDQKNPAAYRERMLARTGLEA